MPRFDAKQLHEIASKVLAGIGATAAEAEAVAEHLVECHLAGHDSHGLIRIPQYYALVQEKKLRLGETPSIERESPTTAVIDGKWSWGAVAANKAVEVAIAKAKETKLAAVAVRNCCHIGRVGSYPLKAAEQGFIAKLWCNVHGIVRMAPWGGIDARMGTDPVAIAIPTNDRPILVDITTTTVAEGKVRLAKNKGTPIPDGWVLNAQGESTNNPADLYTGGTLVPFGGPVGHKGYALALVIEMLGGALSGAGCGAMPGVGVGNGLFLELIDPSAFVDPAEFKSRVDAFVAYVKSSRVKPGFNAILLPGEPELQTEAVRRKEGIAIDDETWKQLSNIANTVGVSLAGYGG